MLCGRRFLSLPVGARWEAYAEIVDAATAAEVVRAGIIDLAQRAIGRTLDGRARALLDVLLAVDEGCLRPCSLSIAMWAIRACGLIGTGSVAIWYLPQSLTLVRPDRQ